MEWSRTKYNEYYNHYMPWIEDKYLQWFGENKTSYTTKETLKTPVTGSETVNNTQSHVAETVGDQFGQSGLLQPVGDAMSKEGFNRAERGQPAVQEQGKSWSQGMKDGAGQVGEGVGSTLGSVGGILGGGGKGDGGDGEGGQGEKGKRKGAEK